MVSDRVYAPDHEGGLVLARGDKAAAHAPGPSLTAIHGALRAFITHEDYPCVGAKAALNKRSYRLAQYGALGEEGTVRDCTSDVQWFARAADSIDRHAATFIAVFDDPGVGDEPRFEEKLWSQLRGMHAIDTAQYAWDPSVSSDPDDPDFSFSIGGSSFFIVGMHPGAERESRRFPYPTLVFNPHAQFVRMREEGSFERVRAAIRSREARLEGSPNPVLADHGTRSEAAQYAGRAHACPWRAPFEPEPVLQESPKRKGSER